MCYYDPVDNDQLSCDGTYCATVTYYEDEVKTFYGCENLSDNWGR